MSHFTPAVVRVADAVGRLAATLDEADDDDLVRGAIAHADHEGARIAGLSDDDLLRVLSDASDARKGLELIVASASAEVSRRSVRELGYAGLAQRKGVRTATALVQQVTGLARGDATRAARAGEELLSARDEPSGAVGDAQGGPPSHEVPAWSSRLRRAWTTGRVSQAQFEAIRGGLGDPPLDRYPDLDPDFLPDAWDRAVAILLDEAATWTVEDLRAQARIARDRLDPVGVTLRFEERFAARSFRRWTDEAGQQHARIVFDDDAAAWVDAMLRAALRPRRGPRFVDADERGASDGDSPEKVVADERSTEQLQYDTILAVLRTGANADPSQAFGDRQPGVRIVVDATALVDAGDRSRMRVTGVGHYEDGGQAVAPGVVEKYLCDASAVVVLLCGPGRPLDVGRERRLFTRAQRIAIAVRDRGCVFPGCNRPPSECEYHHNDHWWDHHGRTDVDDGVPVCRNCHLRLHNQGWRITRERDPLTGDDRYWLHPPPDPATGQSPAPILLSTRSPRRFEAA